MYLPAATNAQMNHEFLNLSLLFKFAVPTRLKIV